MNTESKYTHWKHSNTDINVTHGTHMYLLWHRHTVLAADSRALSPITAENGSAACWEQTIWGICQVLASSKQSAVKNALPWPGQRHPCSAVLHMQRATQSSKFKMRPIIILLRRPVLCPCRLLETVCCSHLSGCRRFACKARVGAATPGRLSPFTLSTMEEAVWQTRSEKELERRRRRKKRQWSKIKLF